MTNTSLSLSLVRDSLKVLKTSSFIFIAAALVVSGFFAPQQALAAAIITPAGGGTNISIDTTFAPGGSRTFTALEGPAITETVAGDIAAGTHTVTLPLGWGFDISSNITISKIGSIVLGSTSVTPTQTSFTFIVNNQSTSASMLIFNGLKVIPIGIIPSIGNMTYSGIGIAGVDGSTNFGTLSTVPGTVAKLVFTTQPGGAEYGSLLNPQPVVKTQDQFSNDSTSGLVETEMVSLSLTGNGVLQGTASLNIGTGAAIPGTATFTDLKVGDVGAVGTKGLTASADGLTSAVSTDFSITPKPITATVTVNNKHYDGTTDATIIGVVLNGLESGDDVTVSNNGTATFVSPNAGTGIVVASTGVTITGDHVGNYDFGGTATGTGNITKKPINVTPTAGQTKVYGNIDPVFAYTFDPALISPDTFTGALGRVAGEDVSTYAYTIGSLENGLDNYALTLVSGTFEITQKALTVTATGVNKVYDANTTATVTLLDDRVPGDDLTLGYTATFTDKNVGNGKTVNITNISITGGTDAGNYILGTVPTATTANITPKPLTVSFTTDANKTYNGNATAAITGRTLDGVIGSEAVDVTGGSATFADKHIGNDKVVTATGFTLSGADKDNYAIGTINTTTGNVNPRPITVTAVTDTKIYNSTASSDETPVVTSTFSPPVALVDTANFIQTYDNKNVGTGKTLTPSGIVNDGNSGANYSYTFTPVSTGIITVKSINVTAQPDTKTYDSTKSSSVSPVVDALETGDAVGVAPTQEYNTKDVGTGKTLTASGLVISDGFGGANYNVTYVNNTAGVINAKELTVTGATTNSKTYDGNPTATVNFTSATLQGVVSGEEALVSLNFSDYSATFNNKNVGTGKTVTVSGLALSGDGASNYSLTQPTLNDGIITVRTLNVTATGVNKVYDANTTATVILGDNRVPGDDVTLGYTANFVDKNVGNGKTVNITNISITGGTDAGNYILGTVPTATTADITAKSLTATITVANKVYDGTTDATITGRVLVGVIGAEEVIPSGGIATFANAEVGNGKVVSATGITINGADISNYSYDGTATGTADILPIPTVVFVDDNWAGTDTWADPDGGAGPAIYFGYDAFSTIQEGITAVNVGGTVNVAAGTYAGKIVIGKPVILNGPNAGISPNTGTRVAEAIITGTDVADPIIEMTSGNLTGLTIDGFTVSNVTTIGQQQVIHLITDGNNIAISNNRFLNNSGRIFISTPPGGPRGGLVIANNLIDGMTQDNQAGMQLFTMNNCQITNNVVKNTTYGGIQLGGATNCTISGNTVENVPRSGIAVDNSSDIAIQNNSVTNAGNGVGAPATVVAGDDLTENGGITIYNPNQTNITVTNNTLTGNYNGIAVRNDSGQALGSGITVNFNRISGSVNRGADNAASSGTLDAGKNWWGAATGPTHASNPGGSGNAVSNNVGYRPWYTNAELTGLDATSPIPTISSSATSPTNVSPIPVTIAFNEAVLDFTADDIVVTNGTKGTLGGSGSTYTINVTPAGQGVVTVNIAANVAWDLSGNYNTASNVLTVTYDSVLPTLTTVSITSDNLAPTWAKVGDTITLTIVSNEDIQAPAVTIAGHTATVTTGADAQHWTASYQMVSGDTESVIAFAINFTDLAGNNGTAVTAVTDASSVTFDKTAPAVSITSIAGDNYINDSEKAAIHVVGTAEAGSTVNVFLTSGVTVSGSGTATDGSFDITIDGTTLTDGIVTPSVTATDAAGNVSAAATTPTATQDTVAPSVTGKTPSANAVGVAPSTNITVTFNEGIIIEEGDVSITPGDPAKDVDFDSDANIAIIDPTDDLEDNTTYTITLAGITDTAGNPLAETTWSFTTSGSYNVQLTQGWNLISMPVVPNNTAIGTVLGSSANNIEAVWAYDAVNDAWYVYRPASPSTSNLTSMTAGYGYWVNYTSASPATLAGPGNLFLEGNNLPPQRTLKAGWNLIGYYQKQNTDSVEAYCALWTLRNLDWGTSWWTMLIGYDNSSKQFTSLDEWSNMDPGNGYWILMGGRATDTYIYAPGQTP